MKKQFMKEKIKLKPLKQNLKLYPWVDFEFF